MIITGPTSMIGSRFLELYEGKLDNLLTLSLSEFNLLSATEAEILEKLSQHQDDVLVHFAGFTDVDGAQTQRDDKNGLCWQLNVEGTKKLTEVAKKLNLKIVYISTDFVFDGADGPYAEVDDTAKSEKDVSWYAWTKLMGEKAVLEGKANFLIARTSYPYRANFAAKLDFVRNIIERLKNNNLYPMYYDQFLTPTFIDNFSKALFLLLKENQVGIWHVVDNTLISAYEASCEIAKIFDADPTKIKKASILEFKRKNPNSAKRPAKGGLKNDKLREFLDKFGISMQDFPNALMEMKKQLEGVVA